MIAKAHATPPVLELLDISFTYSQKNEFGILRRITLDIWPNEILAITGPNGAGKTTLLKVLIGLLKPQKGEIRHFGEPVHDSRKLTRIAGMVFQNPDEQVFYPIVEDDIAFGLKNQHRSPKEVKEEVSAVLSELHISHLHKRSFFGLSFGEKKKVALAGVLATRPKVLILDEPTIGLDPWSQSEVMSMIRKLSESSSVVIATHDFSLLKLATRILFLWNGESRQIYKSFDDFYNSEIAPSIGGKEATN